MDAGAEGWAAAAGAAGHMIDPVAGMPRPPRARRRLSRGRADPLLMHLRARTRLLAIAIAAAACLLLATPAFGAMQSTKIKRNLCETVGGGRFVDIPGFPGEKIDRRLIPDIRWMKRRFHVFITDGFSTAPYHSPSGEHPIGLALDIVPNWSRGGTWEDIARLAYRAEPVQNQPRGPFRWVGWNGDSGHGWGHHLHLSYMHSYTPFGEPARVVYTRKCPEGRIGRKRDRSATAEVETARGVSAMEIESQVAPAVPERR